MNLSVQSAVLRLVSIVACSFLLIGGLYAQTKEKVTIAIGTNVLDASQANNTSLPIYTKCWENEGLDVTLQPTNSNAAMQALLSGQADFVNMGPAAAIAARDKGAPLKAVYLNMRHNFQFPVVLESSSIKTIQDFKGKTMGVLSYGSQMVQIFKGMLIEAGLDPEKDVTFVETGAGAQAVTALTKGRVDIWGTWDSQIATAENMGIGLRRFSSPYAEKLNFGGSYFVRDDMITKRPKVIEKVLRCVAIGSQIVLANPEGALKAHWQIFPTTKPSSLDEATAIKQGLHLINTRIEFLKLEAGAQWGELPPSAVMNMIQFMKTNKLLAGEVNPNDVYTNQFISAVNTFDLETVKRLAQTLPK